MSRRTRPALNSESAAGTPQANDDTPKSSQQGKKKSTESTIVGAVDSVSVGSVAGHREVSPGFARAQPISGHITIPTSARRAGLHESVDFEFVGHLGHALFGVAEEHARVV